MLASTAITTTQDSIRAACGNPVTRHLPSGYPAPVDYRLLGPVELWSAGRKVELRRRQERLLLAVLLLEPGKGVPPERLVELLWPEEQPGNPKRALQVYVSRLRAVLAAEDPETTLAGGPQGYAIDVPPGRTDVELFAGLVNQARSATDLEQRRKLLVDALALWRGPALSDVASEDVRRRLCGGLDESRWAALELRLATELEMGNHQQLLPELAELTAAEPTREKIAVTRMLALYRSGRQADALAVYAALARHLDEELGLEPGPETRDLQTAILRQDESLSLAVVDTTPRELPADIGLLVGRDELLEELEGVLVGADRPDGVPAVVCLFGEAGAGKSAAAVRLGHRLAAKYPGGQLFVRLQDPSGDALPATSVLGRLLRSIGVDVRNIPESVEERSSLLRSSLAGQAVLMVFDDAVDAGQLRPLMPADGRCGVVVTSRQPMLGLEDAVHREVRPLAAERSAELLSSLSGVPARNLTEVVEHCAGLPLALRIVAARLGLARDSLAEVVQALADDSSRLDYLVAGDRAVRASLDFTLRVADPEARRLFALLAMVGADEFSSWVAAPLLATDEPTATAVFERLVNLGLVQRRRTTRAAYAMHGLVRSYAGEQLQRIDEPERDEAERQYLDGVVRLLSIADAQIDHGVTRLVELGTGSGTPLPVADSAAAAGASWLDQEWPVVQAAVIRAAANRPRPAGTLALLLNGYLTVRDERDARMQVLDVARSAVIAGGEVDLEAEIDRCIFSAYAQSEARPELLTQLAERALASAQRTGGLRMHFAALANVAWATMAQGEPKRLLEVATSMVALVDANAELEDMRAKSLDFLAAASISLGRVPEGVALRRRAAELTPPDSRMHAMRLLFLAEALASDSDRGSAHVAELGPVIAQARAIAERIGDELGLAHIDTAEGRLHLAQGELPAAAEYLDRASAVLERRPDPWGLLTNGIGRADLAVAERRPEVAAEVLERLRRDHFEAGNPEALAELERQRDLVLGRPGPYRE